jgi:putrescine---pyruvate transaminase
MNDQPLRNTTLAWKKADADHHIHPFTDHAALENEGGTRVITKAEGCWVEDSEGNRILDAMAGLWCVALGYSQERLAKVAYNQMLELPYYNTFFKTAHPPSIELAEKLASITPEGLDYVFYGSSGSESNDTIVRLVRHFWQLKGQPEKSVIIGRDLGYHGSTLAGVSLGGQSGMHAQGGLPLPGFEHVLPPYWYGKGGDQSEAEFGLTAANALEDKILEIGPEKVAAFIGEPVMGAGGLLYPPETYWPEINRICEKYDILLVADEVITGFGRTGHWFASERYGIKPDLMTFAKAITSGYIPLSAVMVGKRVADTLNNSGDDFNHGYTYSGHPVACAVALENLAIMEELDLVNKIKTETGPYLHEELKKALGDHPLVGEIRGEGMLAAIELVEDKATRKHFDDVGSVGSICRDHCFNFGLIMRATRDIMLISPPMIIEKDEIDILVKRAKAAIDATAKEIGRI